MIRGFLVGLIGNIRFTLLSAWSCWKCHYWLPPTHGWFIILAYHNSNVHVCFNLVTCWCIWYIHICKYHIIIIYIYIKFRLLKPSPTSNQVLMGCHGRKRGPQRHNSQQRNGNAQVPFSTPQRNLHLQILLLSQNCILHLFWFQTYAFSTSAIQIRLISTSTQCDARCHYVNSNWYSGQLTYPPHDLSDCLMSSIPDWKHSPYPSWARFPSPLDKDLRCQGKCRRVKQLSIFHRVRVMSDLYKKQGWMDWNMNDIWRWFLDSKIEIPSWYGKNTSNKGASGSFMSVHGCSSVLGVLLQ